MIQPEEVINTGDSTPHGMELKHNNQSVRCDMKRYWVPISSEFQMNVTGHVPVFAKSEAEAIATVEDRITNHKLEGDLEMEDWQSNITIPLREVEWLSNGIYVDSCETIEADEDIDPEEVLETEVEELWDDTPSDFESRCKIRDFLRSLRATQSAAA